MRFGVPANVQPSTFSGSILRHEDLGGFLGQRRSIPWLVALWYPHSVDLKVQLAV